MRKFRITWRDQVIQLHHYTKAGAIACAYHNKGKDRFKETPAENMAYEDFLQDPSLYAYEITPPTNSSYRNVIGPMNHSGFFEWFVVYDTNGLLCYLFGPMIRQGEPIDDNSHPCYSRHFSVVEKSYPNREIIAIRPLNNRSKFMNSGHMNRSELKQAACLTA